MEKATGQPHAASCHEYGHGGYAGFVSASRCFIALVARSVRHDLRYRGFGRNISVQVGSVKPEVCPLASSMSGQCLKTRPFQVGCGTKRGRPICTAHMQSQRGLKSQ